MLCIQDIANQLRGGNMDIDFDQIFAKKPKSGDSAFGWHQDSAYWPPLKSDIAAANCWLAVTDATLENGCLRYIPGSHLEPTLRQHRPGKDLFSPIVCRGGGGVFFLGGGGCNNKTGKCYQSCTHSMGYCLSQQHVVYGAVVTCCMSMLTIACVVGGCRAVGASREDSHAIYAPIDESGEVIVDVPAARGDVIVHHERVLHSSRPNMSDSWRHAYILGLRKEECIKEERALGFTHSHNADVNWDAFAKWEDSAAKA